MAVEVSAASALSIREAWARVTEIQRALDEAEKRVEYLRAEREEVTGAAYRLEDEFLRVVRGGTVDLLRRTFEAD